MRVLRGRLAWHRKGSGTMHRSRSQVAEELAACICCNECLAACPALPQRIPIETLNRESLGEYISPETRHFAEACYQCGACVPVCPVGLHRDAMMFWLKMRLLQGNGGNSTSSVRAFPARPLPASSQLWATGDSQGRERNRSGLPTESSAEGRSVGKIGRVTPWR